jgi:parallel beta-helix repeat protein
VARVGRIPTVLVACLGAILVLANPSLAAPRHAGTVIDVFPGRHALAKALAKAQPGDQLTMHAGTYKDDVTVATHDISIVGAGDGTVTVDGRCTSQATITVRADNVVIEGITVIGGGFFEIDYQGVGDGDVVADTVMDTCGTGEYGVNLFDTMAVNVAQVTASGFSDSGIYVGGITRLGTQTLYVMDNESFGNARGIIVEDSTDMHIVLDGNDLHDNAVSGIHLTNSDGVTIRNNTATNDGTYGIDLDAGSDKNLVKLNTAMGSQFDLANLGGTKNCFKHNTYQTHQGSISC